MLRIMHGPGDNNIASPRHIVFEFDYDLNNVW